MCCSLRIQLILYLSLPRACPNPHTARKFPPETANAAQTDTQTRTMWRCALNKTRRGCRAASTTATRGLGLHWAADGPAAARALPPPPAPRQRLPQFERPWDRPTCPTVTTRGLRTHPAAAAAAGTGRGADGDPRRPADEAGGEAAAGPTDGSGDAAKEPAAAAATGGGAERGDGGPCGAADEVGGDAAGGDQGRSGGGGGVGEDDDEDDPEALEQMMSQVVNAIWKIGIPPRGSATWTLFRMRGPVGTRD